MGHEVEANLQEAGIAAKAMQEAKIDMLTTFAYSVLTPGCHIRPHVEHHGTTGIRAHLGLSIPCDCALRVGPYAQGWTEGGWTVFNGKRSHEVLNAGSEERIVLLLDLGSLKVDP